MISNMKEMLVLRELFDGDRFADACGKNAYSVLRKLEDKKMIRSYFSEKTPKRGGKARRVYSLEAEGREAYYDMMETLKVDS